MNNIYGWTILGLLIIIIIREVVCWYWKINERLDEQKKQNETLEKILFQLEQINIKVDPDIEIIYEDENDKEEESTP